MAYIASFYESNQADWIFDIVATNADTGEAIDFSTATILFEVTYADDCQHFTATFPSGGITQPVTGTLEVIIPKDTMRNLCAGTYPLGMTYTMNGETDQLLTGSLTVYEGVART